MVLARRTYGIRTNVRMAGKTPPSNGVSFGPTIKASQVKKSDSEIGPSGGDGRWKCVAPKVSAVFSWYVWEEGAIPAVNMPSGAPEDGGFVKKVRN